MLAVPCNMKMTKKVLTVMREKNSVVEMIYFMYFVQFIWPIFIFTPNLALLSSYYQLDMLERSD